MKYVGRGLQFKVYKSDNRIRKIPTSKREIKFKLLLWDPSYIFQPSKLEKEIKKVIREREEVIEELKIRKIEPYLLANLIINGDTIEQDEVTPLGRNLNNYNESTKNIDNYVGFIFKCWRNGFSERTYNLTINNGIDSKGRVILMDFGEITFRKSDVEDAINTNRWRKSWSFKKDMSEKVRAYYDNKMKESLTLSNLKKYWRETG